MNYKNAVYNEETGLWYRQGKMFVDGVKSATYPEAFEKLYGHAPVIPPPVRAPKKEVVLP